MQCKRLCRWCGIGLIAWSWSMAAAAGDDAPAGPQASAATVQALMRRDLVAAPGQEVVMLTVRYAPGGASLPHRHDAQVFVYVLEGTVVMQVEGAPAVTLGPGETFYEGPDDIHARSANASQTAPATILVFMVKDKDAPATKPVTAAGPS
jgi:quercetin dioxygenase-like cupin family protein